MAIKHVVTRGFIGSGTGVIFVPTAGFSSSDVTIVIISGPFKVITQQTYIAGAVTGQGYTAGAIKSEQYGAGPQTQQGDC